uniref:Sec-independent protein translocase component tatA/E n=1 Tax=Lithodesmium undulatum TaxID=59812 RepID=A0A7T6UZQ7_LITUN|nr:Sec-independent protein translocase component tatA/E [Lithodesmium undulatum]QQJ94655.1 Sec-independent protein translocase component tatA/E [Lithodesmium undulatum]
MANINFSKLIILIIVLFLLFGDFSKLTENFKNIFKNYKNISRKNTRKKGSWTLDLWFWKPLLYQLNYFP